MKVESKTLFTVGRTVYVVYLTGDEYAKVQGFINRWGTNVTPTYTPAEGYTYTFQFKSPTGLQILYQALGLNYE